MRVCILLYYNQYVCMVSEITTTTHDVVVETLRKSGSVFASIAAPQRARAPLRITFRALSKGRLAISEKLSVTDRLRLGLKGLIHTVDK
jgi:hypothetical protein